MYKEISICETYLLRLDLECPIPLQLAYKYCKSIPLLREPSSHLYQ